MPIEVAPGTLQVWSDLGCPWSHVVVSRLWDGRRRLGLEGRVTLDHHAFPLELFNNEPTPRWHVDVEAPVARGSPRAPAGSRGRRRTRPGRSRCCPRWRRCRPPGSSRLRPPRRSTAGLRRALFGESRCISLRHVILEVAAETDAVDVAALAAALDDGRARRALIDDWRTAQGEEVRGSAHVFAPDGTNAQNPGIGIGWEDDGSPFGRYWIEHDDPTAIDDLLRRAAE